MNHLRPDLVPREYALATGLIFSLFVSIRLVRFILRAPVVDSEVLCAAVATYLMFALAFSFLDILVGLSDPQAFAWTVVPGAHPNLDDFTVHLLQPDDAGNARLRGHRPRLAARRASSRWSQAVGGLFYMTLLVSRLVSVYSSGHKIEKS